MKRDRNSFFESSNYNMSMQMPYMMNNNIPQVNTASSNYYAAQNLPVYPTAIDTSEVESRLAKIERNINRLDARISKLENSYTTYDVDNSMYMV